MSISDININEADDAQNLHVDLTEISCLDEKIQTLAHKIVSANTELKSVKAKLKNMKFVGDRKTYTNLGFSKKDIEVLMSIPQSPLYLDQLSELQAKKEALKTLIKANHEYLSHYEQQLKKCVTVFEKNHPHYKASQISAARGNIKAVGLDIDTLKTSILIPQRGVGLMELIPLHESENLLRLDLQERGQRIFERAMSCQSIKNLYLEAMLTPDPETGETGPWVLLLRNSEKIDPALKLAGDGCCIVTRRRSIELNADLSDDLILTHFVFELTNAVSSKALDQVHKAAQEGKISREDYAKSKERIEHEGVFRHHSIMRHAVSEKGWDPSMDGYEGSLKNFEDYWANIKTSEHTEFYRKQWDSIREKMEPTLEQDTIVVRYELPEI